MLNVEYYYRNPYEHRRKGDGPAWCAGADEEAERRAALGDRSKRGSRALAQAKAETQVVPVVPQVLRPRRERGESDK